MFVNRAAGDSALRGVDENALAQASSSKQHHQSTKTPTTTKRRAFGDISNRKQQQQQSTKTTKKTPHVSIVPTTKKKKQSGIVPPRTNTKVTFALVNNKSTKKQQQQAPVESVEVSAGRTWSQQDSCFFDDDTADVQDIMQEQEAWQTEVKLFCEEERTRHVRIRQQQQAMEEKELQEKMEALWKQDDAGMCL